jgi:hypothetical protein
VDTILPSALRQFKVGWLAAYKCLGAQEVRKIFEALADNASATIGADGSVGLEIPDIGIEDETDHPNQCSSCGVE